MPVATIKRCVLGLIGLLMLSPVYATSAPKVVVSVAPIHSLVSGLMEGIGSPILLLDEAGIDSAELSTTQKLQLISADMIVWVGPGLERGVRQAVDEEFPVLADKMLALSHYVPLLPKMGTDLTKASHPEDRQANRDLEFWMDPKLAAMAIRQVAFRLARLDPDNLERYLDNEIKLIDQIRQLHERVSNILAPVRGTFGASDTVPHYLAWRFGLAADDINPVEITQGQKLAVTQCRHMIHTGANNPRRAPSGAIGEGLAPGADLYFALITNTATELSRCIPVPVTSKKPTSQLAPDRALFAAHIH